MPTALARRLAVSGNSKRDFELRAVAGPVIDARDALVSDPEMKEVTR